MKIKLSPRRQSAGYALMIVLVFVAISVLVLSSTMNRTGNIAYLNNRNNQFVVTMGAAEAATEKVLAMMTVDYRSGAGTLLSQHISDGTYANAYPTTTENAYWGNFQFSDAQGHLNKTYVASLTGNNPPYVALTSQYAGLNGFASTFRVISNARQLNVLGNNLTNAVQQELQFAEIPVFQFAIFYNSLLEFTYAATFTINGRVHANDDIYVGSASPLTFNGLVTTTDQIKKIAWDGHPLSDFTSTITYNAGSSTNVPTLVLPVGTNNNAASVREIVNMPPPGGDTDPNMPPQRYYNKAEMLVLVSNATVDIQLKYPYPDATTPTTVIYATNNLPFWLNTNVVFYDQRELDYMKTTQIDLGKFITWAKTNTYVVGKNYNGTNGQPNLIYVADNRTINSTTNTAIRITNGVSLPSRGLTLATPNPLYIFGNYNSATNLPASLASDALTILSQAWSDPKSDDGYGSRNSATTTTVNAAIIAGIVYSTGSGASQFSGGVMNLPRLLENWGSATLNLSTSIVNLFNSVRATNQFVNPGTYYNAPSSRNFTFNTAFTNSVYLPPGTPNIRALIRSAWFNPPPNTVNYNNAAYSSAY